MPTLFFYDSVRYRAASQLVSIVGLQRVSDTNVNVASCIWLNWTNYRVATVKTRHVDTVSVVPKNKLFIADETVNILDI